MLSTNFKKDWGISVSGNNINLPNWFDTDGRGFFPRAVDGESRTPGNVQEDAIRNIEGRIDGNHSAESKNAVAASGAVYLHSAGIRRGVEAVIDNNGVLWSFDAARVVPTAEENRPQNIGMTPAIFLGVSKIVPEVE